MQISNSGCSCKKNKCQCRDKICLCLKPKPKPNCRCKSSCICLCRCAPISSSEFCGLSLSLTSSEIQTMEDEETVIFDNIILKPKSCITYNEITGGIVFKRKGNYLVNWNISVEGTYSKPFVSYSIIQDDQTVGTSTLPVSIGQLSGSCIIQVQNLPSVAKLANTTGDIVRLSEFFPIANLSIVKII